MESANEILNSKNVPEDKIITFFKANLRPDYDHSKYHWQYFTSTKSQLFISQNKDELICTQGMIFYPLMFAGKFVNSAKSESSFLLTDFRGKGYFEKLYAYAVNDCVENDINVFWGFTALGEVWSKKLKFEVYDIFYESQYFLSKKIELISYFKSNVPFKDKLRNLIKTLFNRNKKLNIDTLCTIEKRDLKQNEDLINWVNNQWFYENPNSVTLSNCYSFLIDRVAQNHSINYTFQIISINGAVCGYFILNHSNSKTTYLVDIVLLANALNVTVFQSIVEWIKINYDYERVSYLGNIQNIYNKSIFELFTPSKSRLSLLKDMQFVLKVTNKNSSFKNIDNFVLNGLWTEGFKI